MWRASAAHASAVASLRAGAAVATRSVMISYTKVATGYVLFIAVLFAFIAILGQ
jgi:hypothetical protein